MKDTFAVIDTETNWEDQVMSIGMVIADSQTMQKIDSRYYIISPEYQTGGLYADELRLDDEEAHITDRKQALTELKQWLDSYQVQKLFAYNASFDKNHLPEYSGYQWYDIMHLAASRQYNKSIPESADCHKNGKMKRGYGVENILKMLRKDEKYIEKHNAVSDAEDELQIMQLLGQGIHTYEIACLSEKQLSGSKQQKKPGKGSKTMQYTWNDIEQHIQACTNCPLSRTRHLPVMGRGSRQAEIMLIAEAPGGEEDRQGTPFVGRSGEILDRLFKDCGLSRDEIYITNILKCHPPGNRDPQEEEKEACVPYLKYETYLLKPKIIVCLGRVAAQRIISADFKITRQHGAWICRKNCAMTAVYHPSAILRDPDKYELAKQDFLEIVKKRAELNGAQTL